MSFSPVKNPTTPPLFGTVFANSIKAFPAVADSTITFASKPLTACENNIIASPKGISCSPNASMSFSPAKKPTTPPEFGIVVAISAIALPAMEALVTASASNPCIADANPIIASPNGISCAPKALISFSPVKNPITPPEFGRVDAISASVLPAVAAFATNSPSIPAIAIEKSRIASPNGTS